MAYAIDFAAVTAAAARIDGVATITPVLRSNELDILAGRALFFKCENLQRVGAFKFRGAWNAITCLGEEVEHGVCTHSSGNHAQAIALAAKERGVPAYIVMPTTAPTIKVRGVEEHGAEIIFCEPTLEARESTAAEVIERTGATFLHPYDNSDVIAGQGTAALELFGEADGLDALITPIGGGGLLAGSCITARATQPNCRLFGAEPTGADDAARSLAAGELIPQTGPNTICDGLLTSLGKLTWPILRDHLESIVTVTDDEVVEAMRLLHQHLDMIVEPSGAIPLAAVLSDQFKALNRIGRVGLILSGGNIDPSKLPFKR